MDEKLTTNYVALLINFSNGTQMKRCKNGQLFWPESHVRIIILFMPIFTDTHALVKFLEKEATLIVPVKGIQEKEMPQYNGSYSMVWSNKTIYKAVLLFSCL